MTGSEKLLRVTDYALEATLNSGQVFRWVQRLGWWEGVVGDLWVRLRACADGILAQTATPVQDWAWLEEFLQAKVDLDTVLRTFPQDGPMRASVKACRGLRLLRQEPWECLASFLVSSAKQITQIRQVVSALCERFGTAVTVPAGHPTAWSFPRPERLARATEAELRECQAGFRAAYLRASALMVADGQIDLSSLRHRAVADAREDLMRLPGVGEKIANCVLLFAYGFQEAFPVDVWVRRALQRHYFCGGLPAMKNLRHFLENYFAPYGGYAQQYLFHYVRTCLPRRGQAHSRPRPTRTLAAASVNRPAA